MAKTVENDAKIAKRWEDILDEGENLNGFTAHTANGVAKWKGTGKNANGGFWTGWRNAPIDFTVPDLPESPTRPGGRSNRTGA